MRAPISYYGGKQRLKDAICAVLYQSPNWDTKGGYCEPFFGGGAVYFAKMEQCTETINDINDNLITFYRTIKSREGFARVKEMLDGTLYSKSIFDRTARILRGEEEADDVTRAWAVFTHLNIAFGHGWFGGYGFAVKGQSSRPMQFSNRKRDFTEEICERLQNTDIECRDAVPLIRARDYNTTLFYLDPPYAGTFQKYDGNSYTENDLRELLETLSGIEGEFVLSMFPHPVLDEYIKSKGWHVKDIHQSYSMHTRDENKVDGKHELIVASYPFALDTGKWEKPGAVDRLQAELF